MAVVKIIELVGSSKQSSDDAAQQALKQAQTSLRNIRAVDVVSTGLRGENLDEWRAHVRGGYLVEGPAVESVWGGAVAAGGRLDGNARRRLIPAPTQSVTTGASTSPFRQRS